MVTPVAVILSTILSITVIAAQPNYVAVPSSGVIRLHAPPSVAHESEIRAVHVAPGSFNPYPNWDLVAETCADYGCNVITAAYLENYGWRAQGQGLTEAITAAHARGLEFYVHMTCLLGAPENQHKCIDSTGNLLNWMCPTKESSRNQLKSLVEEAASYDIDGFMFDYMRYQTMDICYCSECKAKFEEWLGETIPDSNWPPNSSDFAPGGSRYNEFLEWRIVPMSELVRDMRNWMLEIKPDLQFGAAVWTYIRPYNPASRRRALGQDWNDWIRQGYLDWVSPMLYVNDPTAIGELVDGFHEFGTGGPEGKAAIAPFLTPEPNFPDGPAIPPDDFKAQVDAVRVHGADGWVIWRYGGPGDTGPSKPDIRDYLSVLDMPQTFSLRDITSEKLGLNVSISWITDIPATSKVEYGTQPLFNATKKYYEPEEFYYWDIDHINGTILEIRANVTTHTITLTGLEAGKLYYYRVQSGDQSGIATSKVYTFEL